MDLDDLQNESMMKSKIQNMMDQTQGDEDD